MFIYSIDLYYTKMLDGSPFQIVEKKDMIQ